MNVEVILKMKGIVWFRDPKSGDRGSLDCDPYIAMPSFVGRPTEGVEFHIPFWKRWRRLNIAVDMKALYEANGEVWPPKHPKPPMEDNSEFLEITLR
jgi:hypothetical protein